MKLSLETMERIIKCATAKEMDFLLYVMRYQDSMGVIKGITREEVCGAIGVHKSKFYDIISKLETKGVIRVFWNEKRHGFWTIIVIDNSFIEKESYKKGYINLNTKFLWSEAFLKLTKAEKIICLRILSIYRENRNKIPLRIETLIKWTGASAQSVRKYIRSITSIFDITATSETIIINIYACFNMFGRNEPSERDAHDSHLLNYMLSVKRVSAEKNEIKDTLALFKIMDKQCGFGSVVTAVLKCLDAYNKLIPKYINKMTRIIGKNKEMVELFY